MNHTPWHKLRSLPRKLAQTTQALSALKLVWKSSPSLAILHGLLILLQTGLSVASIYLTKLVVDSLTAGATAADKIAAMYPMAVLIVLAGFCLAGTLLVNSTNQWVTQAQGLKLTEYMQAIIYYKAIAVDVEYYENSEYYNIIGRACKEVQRPTNILYNTTAAVQNALSLVAMMGLLVTIHWFTVPVLILATLPTLAAQLKYSRVKYHWQRQQIQIERQLGYLGSIVASIGTAKELRLFGLGTYFCEWYLRLQRQYHRDLLSIERRRSLLYVGSQAIGAVVLLGLYALIILQTLNGLLRVGDLVMYHQALQQGKGALQAMLNALSSLHEDSLYLSNLDEFLNLEPKLKEPMYPKPFPQPIQQGIVVHQVDFQYAHSSRPALRGISLTIRPGEVIALVGGNGSGKTTLTKLLCRLYEPTDGQITIDGINIRDFSIEELRQQIGVIFQDYVRYDLTVQENIWVGNINLSPHDRRIQQAAQHSDAEGMIQTLPDGYATWLGRSFCQGEELSGGQWQKLALARAFLRDAQLIVLDEPTSALDPAAEEAVFENFRRLIRGRSAILISHRLSTVKMADQIYVMDQGRIVESGTHQELVQRHGTYAHLFKLQAKAYR
jgi:ATP-binding cassette, subfamily B, bacterial